MKTITLSLKIPVDEKERSRIGALCGPRKRTKLQWWVRDAIMEKLARDEDKSGDAA